MKFNLEILDVKGLVENSLALNKPFADEHNIEFKLVKSPKSATVYGDPDRLAQVISNLLSNAAKFSPSGETVKISIERSKKTFRINVFDKGPGIPKGFHDRIFGRFSQANSADNREKGGTGLGLNISKSIIEQHGGTIGFESEEGKGSKFYFDLPERKSETKETRKLPSEGVAETNRRDLTGSRVLVLEDDPDVAKLLSMMLTERGYSVDTAHNAHDAKAMISSTEYAAVTVDILLPDQDGISLVRELRAQEKTRNLATIVVSAKASSVKDEVVSASMGIIDWLDKPIDQNRLIDAVNQAALVGLSSGTPRVLHVEDDADLGKVMMAMIGDSMDYVCVHTFGEARRLLQKERFDLAILDIGLPDGNGLDLLDTLKDSDNDGMPVIIFSSDGVSLETAAKVEAALVKSNHSNQDLIELMNRLTKKSAPNLLS